jgi:hypothetical protein
MRLNQSTARNRMVFMRLSSDHLTGATGKTITVMISKDGSFFDAIAGIVEEVADGWYNVALTSADTDTLGDLAYHITAADCDPTDIVDEVIAPLASAADLATVAAAVATASTNAAAAAASAGSLMLTGVATSGGTTTRLNDTNNLDGYQDGYFKGMRLKVLFGTNANLMREIVDSGDGWIEVSPPLPNATSTHAYQIWNSAPSDGVMDEPDTIDGYSLREIYRGMAAALMGKSSGGAADDVVRAADDSKPRITATLDSNGHRTAITLDLE